MTNVLLKLNVKQIPWELTKKTIYSTCGNLGDIGIKGGPSVHIIDLCGLSDPLLARIPPLKYASWRIGHFYRQIPTNYEYALSSNDASFFQDQVVLEFWKELKMVTQGPLLSIERLRIILKMNLGLFKPNFQRYADDRIPSQSLPISIFENKNEAAILYFLYGIQIEFEKPVSISNVDLSLVTRTKQTDCTVEYESNGHFLPLFHVNVVKDINNVIRIKLPHPTPPTSAIRLMPSIGTMADIPNLGVSHLYLNSKS